MRQLIESYPTTSPATGGDQAKVAALYRGFMDEAAIEKRGAKPLQPLLAEIRKARDREAIAVLMGKSTAGFGRSFFGPGVSDDQKDPDRNTLYVGQSGLGLGDRQMYLEEKFKPQRERYQAYVEQMLKLAGWPKPAQNAAAIMALETKVAEAHWTRAESRDPRQTYNPTTPAELQTYAPGFPWVAYSRPPALDRAKRW